MKRFVDLLLSLTGFILISPFLITIAILIKLIQKGAVFFHRIHPGYMGRPFKLYKFRTMADLRDSTDTLLPDSEHLTLLGQWLRSMSLDELPELINIIKGEMSIVGPRPLLMQYLNRYSPEQARRHEVKPGLTGWAQVNGRNATTWENKFNPQITQITQNKGKTGPLMTYIDADIRL